MKKISLFAVGLLVLFSSNAYAQNFSFGANLPLLGVVDNSNNQFAVGAGLDVGLIHAGPVRVGVGFGFVGYPNRPTVKTLDSKFRSIVIEEFKDDTDLVFTASTGFRVSEVGNEFPAMYVTVLYMRAMTAKNLPGLGQVNNGILMGLTLASK